MYATFCQGPYDESVRYRDFMGWDQPWYSAQPSLDVLLVGREIGLFHLVPYLREGDRVFETLWSPGGLGGFARGLAIALGENRVHGGNPYRLNGRPVAQWPRLALGHSDHLTVS